MLQIDKKMSGGEVEVSLGDSFEVRLPENPTTGYRWQFHPSSGTPVAVEEDSFDRSGGAHGAGGVRHWRLRALEPGVADVRIESKRDWEQRAAETFQVTVRVKPQ